MPLQTVHRPTTFDELFGNAAIKTSLLSVLDREKDRPQCFLFSGPSGCGKSTLAGILKNYLGCADFDYFYYNSANTRGIDTIRDINEASKYAPQMGKVKMYVLDECHNAMRGAQEAALLMLENPQKNVYFVLCTSEPEKLNITLKRRCHHYEVKPLTGTETMTMLKATLTKEGINAVEFPEAILRKIIEKSQGSPGIALNLLDTVVDVLETDKALEILDAASFTEATVIELCRVLVSMELDTVTRWQDASKILTDLNGSDPESVRRAILGYLSKVLLGKNHSARVAKMIVGFSAAFYDSGKAGLIGACYMACLLK